MHHNSTDVLTKLSPINFQLSAGDNALDQIAHTQHQFDMGVATQLSLQLYKIPFVSVDSFIALLFLGRVGTHCSHCILKLEELILAYLFLKKLFVFLLCYPILNRFPQNPPNKVMILFDGSNVSIIKSFIKECSYPWGKSSSLHKTYIASQSFQLPTLIHCFS